MVKQFSNDQENEKSVKLTNKQTNEWKNDLQK